MELVEIMAFTSLRGAIGSNPELNACFPAEFSDLMKKNIMKILPQGAKPSKIYEEVIKKRPVVIYVFKIDEENSRDTLASVGFVLNKNVNIQEFQKLVQYLFEFLQVHNLLTFEVLESHLNQITNALNKNSPFPIKIAGEKEIIFDIPTIVKDNEIKLRKMERIQRGAFF